MKTMYQIWLCEKCQKVGMITISEEENRDFMGVVHKIGRSHRELSPECLGNNTACVIPENINDNTIDEVPEWAREQIFKFMEEMKPSEK